MSSRKSWALLLGCLPLGCVGPLPAENPKTEPDQPAAPIAIQVDPAPTTAPSSDAPVAPPAPVTTVIKDVGFATPECVLYDTTRDLYYVSNINGSPSGVDNNGFISKLKADGSVENLKFIEAGTNNVQLDAPKGMAIVGDTLYVADISNLRRFDVQTGAPKGSVRFPRATFLNAIAVGGDGAVYISDSGVTIGASGMQPTGTDAIYKLVGEKVSVLVKGKELGAPNGLAVEGDDVLMVTLGKNTFTRFDAKGKAGASVQLPGGTLDGLIPLGGGRYLISSWETKSVYLGGFEGGFTAVATDVTSPAAFGYSEKHGRIAVPSFLENSVHLIPFTAPAAPALAGEQPSTPALTAPPPTAGDEKAVAPAVPAAAGEKAPSSKVPSKSTPPDKTPGAKPPAPPSKDKSPAPPAEKSPSAPPVKGTAAAAPPAQAPAAQGVPAQPASSDTK